ncbi:DUF1295-domain-containing protein [Ascobolus immersus RN42]|uniref:DUF1295-domain-containing protein n=1 Tax=Ascobolus immersus RN42 TaxID=1160509 RepID=A0A3N4IB35_ASCIM|nr:DUF1295-domain-containing protein [Ascobolus immersus RN42]
MSAIDILPIIKEAIDAADYTLTAKPYLSLSTVTNAASTFISNPIAAYQLTNPLTTSFLVANVLAGFIFIASEITGDHSVVDRLWSLLPPFYILHFTFWAHIAGVDSNRLDMMATIAVLWGARLTFNFWRKGGYTSGGEDYRWEVIRQKLFPKRWQMSIFNFTFISWYQSILLWAVSLPAYSFLLLGQLNEKEKWVTIATRPDMIFAYGLVLVILFETVADQQQWEFQQAKKNYQKTKTVPEMSRFTVEELERGFLTQGLFSVSRHPNFLAEQLVWVGIYQWSVWMCESLFAWTAAGVLGYLSLFQGSTVFTEWITAGKYPAYKEYQKRVPKFVPSFQAVMGGVPEIKLGDVQEKVEEVKKDVKKKGGNRRR